VTQLNWRRIIYIAALIIVAGVIFKDIPDPNSVPPETLLNKKIILNDFKDLKHPLYEDSKYQPSIIYFPYDYTGDKGDEFYLTIIMAQNTTTVKYVLEKDASGELKYYLKDRWPDITLPVERFESYIYEDNTWVKINEL